MWDLRTNPFKSMDQKGTTFDHDVYIVVGKQCRTESA